MFIDKKNPNTVFSQKITAIKDYLYSHVVLLTLVGIAFTLLVLATYFTFVEFNTFRKVDVLDFEIGKVADRDVIANRELSYVDENATQIRKEARKRLVTAVFKYDRAVSNSMTTTFNQFVVFMESTIHSFPTNEQFILKVQQEYPGFFDKKVLQNLYDASDRLGILSIAQTVFKQVVIEGLTSFPDTGMESFSQSDVEVIRWKNDKPERIEVSKDSLLDWKELRSYISNALIILKTKQSSSDMIYSIIRPFLRENLIYQAEESEAKLELAIKQVVPVLVIINKGQKIIKKGFVITEEAFEQMEVLSDSGIYLDIKKFSGTILCLLMVVILAFFIFSSRILDMSMSHRNTVLLIICFMIVYVMVLLFARIQFFSHSLDLSVVLPTSLLAMILTVLLNQRVGVLMSFIFALGVFTSSGFLTPPSIYALFSAIIGVSVIRIDGKRFDLIISSLIIALVNPLIMLVLLLIFPGNTQDSTLLLLGVSINGFLSGILLIGFLPILEFALNTSTNFRLMEFSDLNSPIMKKMLLSASGTYNHSMMVATLAESACREIHANSLIARVGAYYHDIGKIDQSEYFIENQTNYNKHIDINPRLSATVIRSHVKQGVEKARQLRLPKEVINIISEHHGNSIMQFFFNEAKKLNENVNPEEYTYQGNPPRSKESAVVMLADVVEAACRTLEKPSVTRLEKFIDDLVDKKIEEHQLDNCDLTFKEVGIIKKAFVMILAGYYHTRVEYPNQKDPDENELTAKTMPLKGKL